jgi:AcrR family transcriptional regulator
MSTSTAQLRASNRRPYRLGKRQEKREQTRQRIVEAAVELHSTLGPARTSVAQIAERAGVQRHTFYAHFPDERSLSMACSGLVFERDPFPDPERWLGLNAGRKRIERGLAELYAWFERNESVNACVLRDAEFHELTREIAELRLGPALARMTEILGEGLGEKGRAMLAVGMDFHCWRVLARDRPPGEAARLMAAAIAGLGS